MNQHGATVSDLIAPSDDVSARRSEAVGAVDVEKVNVPVNITERIAGHLANVGYAVGNAGTSEVVGVAQVIAVSELLIRSNFLGPAITSCMGINGHNPNSSRRSTGENDQRTTTETSDFDDLSVVWELPGPVVEPSGLLVSQPTFNISDLI